MFQFGLNTYVLMTYWNSATRNYGAAWLFLPAIIGRENRQALGNRYNLTGWFDWVV
jgi:hypothetical protein